MKLKKCLICEMLFFVLLVGNAYSISNMSTDSTFSFFYWVRDNNTDQYNDGCTVTTRVEVVDTAENSISVNSVINDSISKMGSKMQVSVFKPDTLKPQSKPSNIIDCSEAFEKCEWLSSIGFSYDGNSRVTKLSFPILNYDVSYKKYDYFVDSINDSINLRFQAVNDTVFMGSYLNTKRWNEPQKWLVSKGAVMVLVSNNVNNVKYQLPLRIKSIQVKKDTNNDVNEYIGFNIAKKVDKNYYGIDFLKIVPSITINDLTVADTTSLKPGSSAKISWKIIGRSAEVDSLYIYSKFDNQPDWGLSHVQSGGGASFQLLIPSTAQDSFKVRIVIRGVSMQYAEATSRVFSVKSFRFNAEAVGNSSVALSWNPHALALSASDSLVVAYGRTRSALSKPDGNDIVKRIYKDFSKATDTINEGLISDSLYYFGAFHYKGTKYTVCGSDSLFMKDITPPKNPYELTSSKDTVGNVTLKWKSIGAIPEDVCSLKVILSKEKSYPQNHDDAQCSVLVKSTPKDSLYDLGVLTNTSFFVLVVSDSSGNWSKPADPARVKISAFDPSKAVALKFPVEKDDTLKLFDATLRIRTDDQNESNDVIEKWDEGSEIGKRDHFVVIGQGFVYYRENEIKEPVWVEVPYSGLGNLSPSQMHLFFYDNDGEWLAHEPLGVDTVRSLVSAYIPDSLLEYPFIFMIDTMAPVYTVLSSNESPVTASSVVYDTIVIEDNVKNITIEHFAGAGGDKPLLMNSQYITKEVTGKGTMNIKIALQIAAASAKGGLVSYLKIMDNTNTVDVNLSRPVKRNVNNNSDNVTVAPGGWAPLVVSADLDSSELSFVMINSSAGKTNWSYDKKQMRIIKWDPLSTNKFNASWVEYDSTLSSGFTFKRGSFFWIKTNDTTQIKYGAAIIPSLIDTTPIKLNENEWTDFSNPYPFDISMAAIRDASISKGVLKTELENLQIYSWDKGDSLYSTKQEYLKDMPGLEMGKATIKAFKPYTIKNLGKSVSIYFPPVSTAVISGGETGEPAVLAKKATLSKKRSFRVNSWVKNGSVLSSVYCGYNESLAKDARYSIPPSFSQQRVAVCDEMWKAKWGSVAFAKDTLGGNFYELLFENMSSSKATICASVDYLTGIDNAQKIQWFDMEKNEWIDSKETIEVELNPNQSIVRIVAIGGDQFFREFVRKFQRSVLSLKSIYPNPFGRVFTIKYSLPYQVQNLSFVMFNIRGQQVWKKDVINYRPGVAHLRIDQKVAAGAYVLQMRAKVEGASPKVFNRMIMCTK